MAFRTVFSYLAGKVTSSNNNSMSYTRSKKYPIPNNLMILWGKPIRKSALLTSRLCKDKNMAIWLSSKIGAPNPLEVCVN